jgi:hypothetical protein
MNAQADHNAALRFACQDNPEAIAFLQAWNLYVHAIDDLIDGDAAGPEAVLRSYAQAIGIYTSPFFLKNLPALRQVAINTTNAYADAVAGERSAEPWRREFADHYRHFGAEMVLAVASIVGGYDHMRAVSREIRLICYHEHHDAQGNPI